MIGLWPFAILAQSQAEKLETAATVNGAPVFSREVEREVEKVVKGRKIESQARRILQAEALERLISRQLILQYLTDTKRAASDDEIKLAIEQARDRLKQQELTLEQFLDRSQLTMEEFTRTLQWQFSWQKYLDAYVTEKNLELHFQRNRQHFDGTQIRVSQILLKVGPKDEQDKWRLARDESVKIREQIMNGTLSFAEAAGKHSQAPSATKGGDIGLISRHEPMPESFSKVAFDLKQNRVSQPVVTTFGVHLIMCVEIQPGQKTSRDVHNELRTDLVKYLFDWVANQKRAKAVLEYNKQLPHFKTGTKELAN